jgi:EpsI family protein
VAAEGGWLSSPLRVTSWRPAYDGYARDLRQGFAKDGHEVGLYIVYYRDQQQKGRELITSTNTLVKAEDSAWRQLAQGSANVDWMGRRTSVDRAQVSGEGVRLEVFGLYWIEGRVTSSRILAKLLLAWSVLRGDGDDAAAIFMYSRDDAGSGGAHEALQSFAAALSPAIERSLDAARRGGR